MISGPAVLLPFVKAEFHLTFAQAGLIANLPFAGGFLVYAIAGWTVDAVGDRFVLVLGGAITGLAALAFGVSPSFAIIVGALLCLGAGSAMPTPAGSVAVRKAFPPRLRGTVMSIRQTGFPLGGFLAALTLPSIALAAGWRSAMVAAGAASIIVAVVGLTLYRSGPHLRSTEGGSRGILHVLTRDITILAIGGIFLVAAQMSLLTYLVAYLIHDRSLHFATAAIYLAVAQFTGVTGRILWGLMSDRVLSGRRRLPLLVAAAIGALGSLALAILPDSYPLPLIVIAVLLCSIGAVGWNGVQISFLSELGRSGSEGRSVGLALMMQQPGILAGPFLFGLIVDASGSFRLAWLLVAAFLGMAMIIMSAVRESPKLQSALV